LLAEPRKEPTQEFILGVEGEHFTFLQEQHPRCRISLKPGVAGGALFCQIHAADIDSMKNAEVHVRDLMTTLKKSMGRAATEGASNSCTPLSAKDSTCPPVAGILTTRMSIFAHIRVRFVVSLAFGMWISSQGNSSHRNGETPLELWLSCRDGGGHKEGGDLGAFLDVESQVAMQTSDNLDVAFIGPDDKDMLVFCDTKGMHREVLLLGSWCPEIAPKVKHQEEVYWPHEVSELWRMDVCLSELSGTWRDGCGLVARIRDQLLSLLPDDDDPVPLTVIPDTGLDNAIRCSVAMDMFGQCWHGVLLRDGRLSWDSGDVWVRSRLRIPV